MKLVLFLMLLMTSCASYKENKMPQGCAKPRLINKSRERWLEVDYLALETAIKNCKFYYSDAPCLKTFIKTDVDTFRAICGSNDY